MPSQCRPLLTLLPFCGLLASPAHAAAGGTTLPFNEPLSLITDNLAGPTANTIIVAIIIAGLVTLALSKEEPWLKKLGGTAVLCALIAKASSLPGVLGLGAAGGQSYAYQLASLALQALTALLIAAILWLLRERRSQDILILAE